MIGYSDNRPPLPPRPNDYGPDPYVVNLERVCAQNIYFRNTLWTDENLQVTLMSIPRGGEIGVEMHKETDQVLVVVRGAGTILMGSSQDRPDFRREVIAGDAIFVPSGIWHNYISDRRRESKLFSVYAPPHHEKGTIELTKSDGHY